MDGDAGAERSTANRLVIHGKDGGYAIATAETLLRVMRIANDDTHGELDEWMRRASTNCLIERGHRLDVSSPLAFFLSANRAGLLIGSYLA
jgi:hypothetical protein